MVRTMSKAGEITSTGRVTRVEMDCAYLTSDEFGKVFVTINAVLPSQYGQSDLRGCLKVDDVVGFVAVPQVGHECQWLALRVYIPANKGIHRGSSGLTIFKEEVHPSASSDAHQNSPGTSTSRKEVVTVTLVTETFVFGVNESLSTVFVPATAFLKNEHAKLSDYVACGDCLLVLVRPLAQSNGCQWIAVCAVKITQKHVTTCDAEHKGVAYARTGSSEVITCPILTWTGGNNGNMEAEGLDEVVAVGDTVYVEACHTAKGWRARRWSSNEPAAGSSDSYTQTAMTPEQMIIRAIGPELCDFLKQRIPNVLAYAEL